MEKYICLYILSKIRCLKVTIEQLLTNILKILIELLQML